MGVDVTHIIRHDFKDVKNHKAAKKYQNINPSCKAENIKYI